MHAYACRYSHTFSISIKSIRCSVAQIHMSTHPVIFSELKHTYFNAQSILLHFSSSESFDILLAVQFDALHCSMFF